MGTMGSHGRGLFRQLVQVSGSIQRTAQEAQHRIVLHFARLWGAGRARTTELCRPAQEEPRDTSQRSAVPDASWGGVGAGACGRCLGPCLATPRYQAASVGRRASWGNCFSTLLLHQRWSPYWVASSWQLGSTQQVRLAPPTLHLSHRAHGGGGVLVSIHTRCIGSYYSRRARHALRNTALHRRE